MTTRAEIYSRAIARKELSIERAKKEPTKQNLKQALRNILIAAASSVEYKRLSSGAAEYLAREAAENILTSDEKNVSKSLEHAEMSSREFIELVVGELEKTRVLGGKGHPLSYIGTVRKLRKNRKFCGVFPFC